MGREGGFFRFGIGFRVLGLGLGGKIGTGVWQSGLGVGRKDWDRSLAERAWGWEERLANCVATLNFGRGRKNSIGVARGGSGGFVPIIDGKLRGKNGLLRGRMFVLIFEH